MIMDYRRTKGDKCGNDMSRKQKTKKAAESKGAAETDLGVEWTVLRAEKGSSACL
jgi:hypothetical protein